ncbi:MAG: nitroreductase family protein [Planctomycetaceae bacterium]
MLRLENSAAPPPVTTSIAGRRSTDHSSGSPVARLRIIGGVIRRLRGGLAHVYARLDGRFARWAGRSTFASRIYYGVWNDAFGREQQAVLCGRHQYSRDVQNPLTTSALLRRNCHRLEKGLLMRPRRDVFAAEYIEETVDVYCAQVGARPSSEASPSAELQWAYDVLSGYFQVAGPHPRITTARTHFEMAARIHSCSSGAMIPYRRDLSAPPSVRLEDLAVLAKRRRSVRWFLQRPVPREMIDAAVEVAAQSPSACNRQPFQFRIFDHPELVQEVAALPMGTAGYAHNIPVIVVIVGQQRNYFDERDRHLIYIDGSLAAMGFVYALEAQGLSSCCINWPDVEERESALAKLLKLWPDERAVMCLAVGYPDPDGLVAYSQKKPLEQLRRYNFE